MSEIVVHKQSDGRFVYELRGVPPAALAARMICTRCNKPVEPGHLFVIDKPHIDSMPDAGDIPMCHEDCWEPTSHRAAGLDCCR